MRIRTSIALGILFSLASLASPPLLQAATFSPAAGQEEVPLVEGKAGSGVIRFSASGVSERIVRGRRGAMLSIPIEVDNRSHKDLLLNTLDIWVVTPDGTVLSQPELRQNGVAVWRAEVNARKRSQLVALFRLGSAAAFDSFELHWGGLLAYRPRTGVVSYAAAPGGGYVPQASAAAPSSAGSESRGGVDDQYAYEDISETDPYWTLDDPGYWNEPYYGLSYGFIYGDPWYSYGYYPYYGYFGYGYGYGYYPPYYPGYPCSGCSGSSGRQVKEDAILRQAGSSPVRDPGRGRLVDTATARSRGRASGEPGRVITTTSRSSSGRVTGSRTSSRRSSVGRATTYRGSRGSVGRSSGVRSGGGRSGGGRSSGVRSGGGRSGGGRSSGGRASGGSRSSGRGRGR